MIIFPTLDIEGTHGRDPFDDMILGKTSEGEFGTLYIAKIFNKYRISATFFIDIYEYTFWGEERFKSLCNKLLELDQDVQLHTHPSWRNDPRDFDFIKKIKKEKSYLTQDKDFMAKLSLQEQTNVLEEGKAKLYSWTGIEPIAHRSGGYSINSDTIEALKKTGFLIDSSIHNDHKNSQIKCKINTIQSIDGIIELPITYFKRSFSSLFNQKINNYFSDDYPMVKTSIDSCSSKELLIYATTNESTYMNLFFHGYSLLKFDSTFAHFSPAKKKIYQLESFLEKTTSKDSNIEYCNMKNFISKNISLKEPEVLPAIPNFLKSLNRKIRYSPSQLR